MKSLEEKKLLVKMARAFGQPVEQELLESIEREEKLAALLFKQQQEVSPPIPILKEDVLTEIAPVTSLPQQPAKPAETNLQPPEDYKVNQVAAYLDTVSNTKKPPLATALMDKEFEALRKTVMDLLSKVNTLSWGSGGSGAVRFTELDDHHFPKDIDYLSFNEAQGDLSVAQFAPAGTLYWNTQEDCLNIKQNDNTVLQVGLEQYIRVRNLTGNTMNAGTLVQFGGVNGGNDPIAVPLLANSTFNPIYTIGVLTEPIANSDSGRATTFGKVRDLDTTGTKEGEVWSLGNLLWASPSNPGYLTNVKPTAPNVAISIAAVTKVDAVDGEILVRPTITPRLFYGDFVRTSGQTANAANTAYVIELNKTEFASGFTLNANSEMVALESGLYKVSVTLNFSSSSASLVRFYHWIRVNGQDVPDSTIRNSLASNGGDAGATSNHIVSLNAGDNVQIMWATEGTQVSLVSAANTAFAPSSPSAIVNIFQITL
jgi:hypothetical protein